LLWAVAWVVASGCSGTAGGPLQPFDSDLTSVGGSAQTIVWDSFVYVAPDADDAAIQAAIARQVKSALGALREKSIGIGDRGALHNLDPAGWTRELLTAVDPSTPAVQRSIARVRYHYSDTALVDVRSRLGSDFTFVLLAGDYTQPAASAALQPACVDEATDPDSLWYHFQPDLTACRRLIKAEADTVNAALAKLTAAAQVPVAEAERRFLTVRAHLTPLAAAPTKYPEYDRLWGFGSDREKVIVYAFVGVEHDERDSHDISSAEYQRLLRTLRQKWPELQVVDTQPSSLLLDFSVDGQPLEGVTWDDVAHWMIDGSGYPTQVGTDATKIEALRQQVIDRFSERTIVWQMRETVTMGGETRAVTVEIRTFWGLEDGDPDARQRATWRYLEAFWYGDVFAYAGHSHFGHGPLEPTNYAPANFPDRYQIMLVNSCLSYNYYDLDFIEMHPEGSRDLEVVMNGLPAYWNGMGESTAKYVIGLLDGGGKSYAQLLDAMKITDPAGRPGYEPMRGVNGELDNVYDPTAGPITFTPAPAP
jgi:hypothetical protein